MRSSGEVWIKDQLRFRRGATVLRIDCSMARADRRAALNQAISAIPSILSGGRLIVPAPAYRPVNLLPTRRDKQLTVIDGNGSVLVTERNPKTWYVSTRVPVLEKTVHYSRRGRRSQRGNAQSGVAEANRGAVGNRAMDCGEDLQGGNVSS